MAAPVTPIDETPPLDPAAFAARAAAARPFVMRGLASDWPLVRAGAQGGAAAAFAEISRLDSGQPAEVMIAPPEVQGKFFYGPQAQGLNFTRQRAPLSEVARRLLDFAQQEVAPAVYAGAAETRQFLPRFDAANPLPLAAQFADARSRVWLSNRAVVATHFDLSDNVAVVAFGRRRFTLFPPEATGDLYVGPLHHTLAGQPISMADPDAPDPAAYPRFAAALDLAQVAELGPGDALFIPTMWWHHVRALDPLNVLVNYWYNDQPHGGPFLAFIHALGTIRDLPEPQRDAWRAWFEHFVFGAQAPHAAEHLPLPAQGPAGPPSPQRSEMIRQFVLRVLTQG